MKEGRRRVAAATEWADRFGYSRAVRRGRVIEVSGTVGINADGSVPADAGAQARRALQIVLEAVAELGGNTGDVVRTRLYVTDIDRDAEAVGQAHGDALGAVLPVTSMIGVAALISPGFLVEVEATAILGSTEDD